MTLSKIWVSYLYRGVTERHFIKGIKIGKWFVIGSGTVIIKNISGCAVVVGNPGKIIKYNDKNLNE
jgi:acetyltransferase-like isoleucine patch superfamily enzyme